MIPVFIVYNFNFKLVSCNIICSAKTKSFNQFPGKLIIAKEN